MGRGLWRLDINVNLFICRAKFEDLKETLCGTLQHLRSACTEDKKENYNAWYQLRRRLNRWLNWCRPWICHTLHIVYSTRRYIVDKNTVDYYRSRGSHVFVCFIDFSTAFDTVNYWKLFTMLLNDNIDCKIVRTLAYWYSKHSVLLDGAIVYLLAFI